jgi:hypothetical protein
VQGIDTNSGITYSRLNVYKLFRGARGKIESICTFVKSVLERFRGIKNRWGTIRRYSKQCDFSLRINFLVKYYFRTVGIHLEFGLNTSNVLSIVNYTMIKVAEQVVITWLR